MKESQRRNFIVVTLVVLLCVLFPVVPCFSEPRGEGGPEVSAVPLPEDDQSPQAIEKRKKIRERIELIRMWKLAEALQLNEETGAKLFPILRNYDKKWIRLQGERRTIMQGLRKALQDEGISDKEIEAAMVRMEENSVAAVDLLRQQRQEVKGILSPRQQARFILFQRRFHREIRRVIAEARERKIGARRHDRLREN